MLDGHLAALVSGYLAVLHWHASLPAHHLVLHRPTPGVIFENSTQYDAERSAWGLLWNLKLETTQWHTRRGATALLSTLHRGVRPRWLSAGTEQVRLVILRKPWLL